MAKAKVNFYWKGVYIKAGTEAPKDAPKTLTTEDKKKVKIHKEKVSYKASTGSKKEIK